MLPPPASDRKIPRFASFKCFYSIIKRGRLSFQSTFVLIQTWKNFFSLFSLEMRSSRLEISSLRDRIVWSRLVFSVSAFAICSSRSDASLFTLGAKPDTGQALTMWPSSYLGFFVSMPPAEQELKGCHIVIQLRLSNVFWSLDGMSWIVPCPEVYLNVTPGSLLYS